MDKTTLFDSLVVVKRSGQRTTFQGEKIAIAIGKAFRSLDIPYNDEDVNKVYANVLKKIETEYQDRKTITIENIQDIIEEALKDAKLLDVYNAFSTYRNHRNASRKAFVIKQQHKFLKAIETLGLNNLEENCAQIPTKLITSFGSTISYEFAKAYLLDTKSNRHHDSGLLYIHSIETMPIGSIDSLEIDLLEVMHLDTSLATSLREENSLYLFLDKVKIMLENLAKEQHGMVTFSHFEKSLIPITLKQYKENIKNYCKLYLALSELDVFISISKIEKEIDKIEDLITDNAIFNLSDQNTPPKLSLTFTMIIDIARKKTEQELHKTLTHFFTTLKEKEIGFNFGTDTSLLGQMIIKEIIISMPQNSHLHYFFKIKKGLSKEEKDPNYTLLMSFLETALTKKNCHFSFLDSSFNNYKEEVCYFPKGARVIEDTTTIDKKLVGGKGNLATVSINIVRLALKNTQQGIDLRGFYKELEIILNAAKDALLERFEVECNKHSTHFSLLYASGLWHDGDKIKPTDRLRKLLKHGTLTIHFCGLKEVLILLQGDYKSDKAYQLGLAIVSFMKRKIDLFSEQNNLNFVLSATTEETIAREFKKQDTAIFGKIKNVTDHEMYESGYMISNHLEKLAPFQQYTLGGHLIEVTPKNKEQLKKILFDASKCNVGCLKIVPIDKD